MACFLANMIIRPLGLMTLSPEGIMTRWGNIASALFQRQRLGYYPSAESICVIYILPLYKSGYNCLAQSGQMP
jgi:hypothetical protein